MIRIGDATTDEEARAYLQARLTALWQVMFWAFVTLLASHAPRVQRARRADPNKTRCAGSSSLLFALGHREDLGGAPMPCVIRQIA